MVHKYVGWNSDDAVKHYLGRISARIPHFETMEEKDLNWIKVSARPVLFGLFIDPALTWNADDKCWRKADSQQLQFWLSFPSYCLLPSQPSYQIEAHIFR